MSRTIANDLTPGAPKIVEQIEVEWLASEKRTVAVEGKTISYVVARMVARVIYADDSRRELGTWELGEGDLLRIGIAPDWMIEKEAFG